ncbi:centromere protein P [Gouania willdenowi]|uniref:Centromere protein P n=1 Tax=Gouania willdenowi TaxID=441366 RepID=A0A8C5D8Y5_GOUWI|nr:centromere protein P [Gouania willdenowi]XP_028301992.1 centromere protein P [Gouania willdenowi]
MEKMSVENKEQVEALEAQIESLQAEVEELQRQKQDNQLDWFHFKGHTREAMMFLCKQRPEQRKQTLVSKLIEEGEELEEDLKQQTQMNGIVLNGITTKTLQSSSRNLIQQICISGHCSDLVFNVEFKLSEVKEADRSERRITEMNVVLDSFEKQNFSIFLSGVEESRDLPLFFRTLRTFSDRCGDRSRAFLHFKDKFPSLVSVPGCCRSEVMTLNHPQIPSFMLFFHWTINVSAEGAVSPHIDLLTKIPKEALKLFPSQPVGGASEAFHSLQRILGTEAAMESIIRAVGLFPDNQSECEA